MTVELRVKAQALTWRALSPEDPLEGSGGCACDHCSEEHAPAKAPPGRASPDEGRCRAEQPQRAVAAMGGDECQKTHETCILGDGETSRESLVVGDELLQRNSL